MTTDDVFNAYPPGSFEGGPVRWDEADRERILRDLQGAMVAVPISPAEFVMSERVWLRLKRRTMSKRAFRRLRGRMKVERRAFLRRDASLPDGLFEVDGGLVFECRSCGADTDFDGHAHEFSPDMAYCGGSPRCLP